KLILKLVLNFYHYHTSRRVRMLTYLKFGSQANAYLSGRKKHSLLFSVDSPRRPAPDKARKNKTAQKSSTSLSKSKNTNSGTEARRMRGYDSDDGFIVDDDDDDPFEPMDQDSMGMPAVREAGSRRRLEQPRGTVGAPITNDDFTAGLNFYEVDIMNRFYEEAKRIRERVSSGIHSKRALLNFM